MTPDADPHGIGRHVPAADLRCSSLDPATAEYTIVTTVRTASTLITPTRMRGVIEMSDESTQESLNGIEKQCEMDQKCHQTAVTFVEGKAACAYHAGVLF